MLARFTDESCLRGCPAQLPISPQVTTIERVTVVPRLIPVSAGARCRVPETRFGLQHRTQLATRITAVGLSNLLQLRAIERSCFRATCAPLTSACASTIESAWVSDFVELAAVRKSQWRGDSLQLAGHLLRLSTT